jgi:hypothetical protein
MEELMSQEMSDPEEKLLLEFYDYCMDEHNGILREEFIYMFLELKKEER